MDNSESPVVDATLLNETVALKAKFRHASNAKLAGVAAPYPETVEELERMYNDKLDQLIDAVEVPPVEGDGIIRLKDREILSVCLGTDDVVAYFRGPLETRGELFAGVKLRYKVRAMGDYSYYDAYWDSKAKALMQRGVIHGATPTTAPQKRETK